MAKATMNRRSKVGRPRPRKSTSPRRALERPRGESAFPERKSIEELAAEQGVKLEGQLERIWGAGADLWASDKEFEDFVQGIYARRRESLTLSKR